MHRDDIHVALHKYALLRLCYRLFRLKQPVKLASFQIYVRFRRIDIFGNLLFRTQRASAECHHLSGQGEYRIYHSATEAVIDTPVVSPVADPRGNQILLAVSTLDCRLVERVASFEGISEMKLLDHRVTYASVAEI